LSNDVIFEDPRVSRRHAELRWRSGSYYLSDLGSRSGTTHNGQTLSHGQEVPVADGDVISLAGVTLIVRTEAGQSSAE
jgi:pSer/pThr/pTyr-binding forkhead associated (FHA) protein